MSKNKTKEPEYLTSPINSQVINYNVYKLSTSQKLLYTLLLFVAGGLVANVFYGGLFKSEGEATVLTYVSNLAFFSIGGLIANKLMMPAILNRFKKKRLDTLKLQFRDLLSSLSTTLSSGMNMNDSINTAYSDLCKQYGENSYIAQEVSEIIACVKNGISFEDAFNSLGERSGIEDISNFSVVFSVSFSTGGNIKDVVRRTADLIVEKMLTKEEVETKIASNKIQLYAMLVIPVVLVMMMKFMSTDFAESFSSIIGVIANTIALGLVFVAYKVGVKILDVRG